MQFLSCPLSASRSESRHDFYDFYDDHHADYDNDDGDGGDDNEDGLDIHLDACLLQIPHSLNNLKVEIKAPPSFSHKVVTRVKKMGRINIENLLYPKFNQFRKWKKFSEKVTLSFIPNSPFLENGIN